MSSLYEVVSRHDDARGVGRCLCGWRDPVLQGLRSTERRLQTEQPGDTTTIRHVADASGIPDVSIPDDLTTRHDPDTTYGMCTMPPTATVSLLDKPAGGSLVLDWARPCAALTAWGLPMGRGATMSSLTFDHSYRHWSPLHLTLTLPPSVRPNEGMEASSARVGRRDLHLSGSGSVRLSHRPVPWPGGCPDRP